MMGVVFALIAGWGAYLLWTSIAFGWGGLGISSHSVAARLERRRPRDLLVQAGIPDVRLAEFGTVSVVLGALGAMLAWAIFAALAPAVLVGVAAMTVPVASARRARLRRLAVAREGWPRMIEELRLQAVSLGRSIPQALFEVGARGPDEFRSAFAAARREWLMTTDFERTLVVLRQALADPTADAICETLLIAHEIGGQEVDGRLRALLEDRVMDLDGRKDAASRQAGARFARAFVLIVPLGMALVGLSIGDGRLAYQSPVGQIGVVVALGMIAACWVWAAQIMRLPNEGRVFATPGGDRGVAGTGAG